VCPGRPLPAILPAIGEDPPSQAELLPPVGRDQVGVRAVPDDPVPYERAVGQNRQLPLPGRVQAGLHQAAGQALAAEAVVNLGMGERDLGVAQIGMLARAQLTSVAYTTMLLR